MLFELNANTVDMSHPSITIMNPTTATRQICQRVAEKTEAGKQASAVYTFASGQHGSAIRIDILTGEYSNFLNALKRNLALLDSEGKPRELVVHYGRSQNAQETCESVTQYLEGTYTHNREAREITFIPADGNDALYVMELVDQYKDLMCLRRKEALIHKFEVNQHAATGVFAAVQSATGVPCVSDNDSNVRFLARTENEWRQVTYQLMGYKVAYSMDKW